LYDSKYFGCVDRTPEHTMDNVSIPQSPPETTASCDPDREQKPSEKLQTITDACAAMKDVIASEAQQIISGTESMGKQPTFTEACSTMKEQMAAQAQHIVGAPPHPDKTSGAGDATSLERHLPHSQQIEQAKMALREANWFEQ
jgi:hypothetical protein